MTEPETTTPVSLTPVSLRPPGLPRGRYGLDREALAALLADEPPYRLRQIWDGFYRRLAEPEEMTDLPVALRARLGGMPELAPTLELEQEALADDGETRKWLFRLSDRARIETVLMHYPERTTVCVSSQAGCALECSFCATGQAGFSRNLSTGEIVEQVVRAARAARESGRRLDNVVFMGMGEPLVNYGRLLPALRRINGDLGLAARHLTVSTVGIVPGILRLAAEQLQVNLAVSLHAANDELRDSIVPINRRYPLALLMEACATYLASTNRRISFEWALIDGVNDRRSDAAELAGLANPLGAHVNLIPLNPTPGYPVRGTPRPRVEQFQRELAAAGVNATVRRNRGTDIAAACGQLAATAPAG